MEETTMTPEDSLPSSQSTVSSIRLDYSDGSSDDIELLQLGDSPLYGLRRKRPGSEVRNLGAHTDRAIVAILLHTLTTTERIEYSLGDPKIRAVLRHLSHDQTAHDMDEEDRE